MSRMTAVLVLVAALVGTACDASGNAGGDSPTDPSAVPGRYRLESVLGQPLPFMEPPSLGNGTIRGGDLLLRDDGTFALGLSQGMDGGLLQTGRWTAAHGSIQLAFEGGASVVGSVAADSVAVVLRHPMTFRRTALPVAPVNAGTWVLSAVDGRATLTSVDTVGDDMWHQRVVYDSIVFTDALFFRRARLQVRQLWQLGVPAPLSVESYWLTHGRIEGADPDLVLRDYGRMQAVLDTLRVQHNTLTRWSPYQSADGTAATRAEVYTRMR